MIKKILSFVIVMLLTGVMLAGCAAPAAPTASAVNQSPVSSAPETSSAAASSAAQSSTAAASNVKTINVVDIVQSMQNESQAFSLKMLQKHAVEYGVNLTYLDSKADPATEAQNVSTAIAQGADAIIVNPNDIKGIVPSLKQAKEAGYYCLYVLL